MCSSLLMKKRQGQALPADRRKETGGDKAYRKTDPDRYSGTDLRDPGDLCHAPHPSGKSGGNHGRRTCKSGGDR